MGASAWHLDENEGKQQTIFNDVLEQLKTEILPTLSRLSDIREWVRLLQSASYNHGTGRVNSPHRNFLLGFTYLYQREEERARIFLMKSKKASEKEIQKFSKHLKTISPDSPLRNELKIVDEAIRAF